MSLANPPFIKILQARTPQYGQPVYVEKILTPGGAGVIATDAEGNLVWSSGGASSLPDQTGHAGQFLTTDGTNASWAVVSGGGDAELAGDNVFTGTNTFEGPTDFEGDVNIDEMDAQVVNVGAIAMNGAPATDDTYSGLTIIGKNAGATLAQWDAVYLGAAFTWLIADANGTGTFPAAGLVVAAATSGNPAIVLTRGIVRNDAWNWIAGRIYLSTTAGGLTQTPPSLTTEKVQDVGFALSADVAYLDFNGTYLTVA